MRGRFSVSLSVPRVLFFVCALCAAALAAACGSDSETASVEAAPAQAAPIAGLYQVAGTTVATRTGVEREISGTIILADEGDEYVATFNLTTFYPVGAESLPAEVIGTGKGTINGRTLTGTASTQLVVATVPGVDPAFAYIPRTVSTRIVSTSRTEIEPDGMVTIEISNQPAEGELYEPTKTTLTGVRLSAARGSPE